MPTINLVRGPSDQPVVQLGVHHMTPAAKHIHSLAYGTHHRKRRGKKKTHRARAGAAVPAIRSKRRHRKSGGKRARGAAAKFVAGSSAAKRHMAKLRAMRGRKPRAA